MGAVDHVGFKQLEIADIGIVALELAHVLDILELAVHPGAVRVALAVNEDEDGMAVFPSVLSRKPTGRFWERKHAEEEDDGRDHLEAPWDAECSRSVDK